MSRLELNRLREIYDGFSAEYDRGRSGFDNTAQLEMLAERISREAKVLDAGCGSGDPVLRFFAEHGCRVTGTDISPAMLALAEQHVPAAHLVQVDSTALEFEVESFDLITSFYSLFHLEMDQQKRVFELFFQMLRRGGSAYFTLASEEYTDSPEFSGTKEFAGVELPYHHVRPETYRSLLDACGLTVECMELLTIGGETMLWVLARKKGDVDEKF